MLDPLDALQWPAMAVTLLAAWLVGSPRASRRTWGFWTFVASNLLWTVWGLHTQAYALIVLQAGLFLLNLRGVKKNERAAEDLAPMRARPRELETCSGVEQTGCDHDQR